MKTHEGFKRGFFHLSASWYGKACLEGAEYVDQVLIGFYHPQGGTSGEFAIRWIPLNRVATPRLEVFDDAWDALYQFSGVLEKLAEHDGKNISPKALCELLIACGVQDMTKREVQG